MFDRFRQKLSWRLTRDTVLVAMVLGLLLNLVQITLDYFTARDAMERDGISVAEAAYDAGYSSPANFSTAFKRMFGLSPREAKT